MLPNATDTLGVSGFAAGRHTPENKFSDFPSLTWEDILTRCRKAIAEGQVAQGYAPGVVEVSISPEGIRSNVVHLQEGDKLSGVFEARRPGETPRISFGTPERHKAPAQSCLAIFYSRALLEGEGEEITGADWDLVTLNGAATLEREPIHPDVLMHNHFGSDGGSATEMSPQEFEAALRESFLYWRDKATCQ